VIEKEKTAREGGGGIVVGGGNYYIKCLLQDGKSSVNAFNQ